MTSSWTVRAILCGGALLLLCQAPASAQTGYGVDANFTLFSFNVTAPATSTTIGNVGFLPEAIDFRPGTNQL